MRKSPGIKCGAVAGVFVGAALTATWFLAQSVCDSRTRLQSAELRSTRTDIRRYQSTTPTIPNAPPTAPREASLRDGHFKDLLEGLASRQRQESFEAIFSSNSWGNAESRSGDGSTEKYTENARNLLSHTIKEYGVKDWIDSPCGDCNWQWLVDGIDDVAYLGLDIVPALIEGNKQKHAKRTNMSFKQQDFINEPFPHQPDLILCRDMIQHNTLVDGVRAYYNMEKSGAKYLATTWHHQGADSIMTHNTNQPPGGMYYVNIFLHPFNFSKPEYFIREGGSNEPQNKIIGLWKLPALGLGDGQFFEIPQGPWDKAETELVHVMDMGTP